MESVLLLSADVSAVSQPPSNSNQSEDKKSNSPVVQSIAIEALCKEVTHLVPVLILSVENGNIMVIHTGVANISSLWWC